MFFLPVGHLFLPLPGLVSALNRRKPAPLLRLRPFSAWLRLFVAMPTGQYIGGVETNCTNTNPGDTTMTNTTIEIAARFDGQASNGHMGREVVRIQTASVEEFWAVNAELADMGIRCNSDGLNIFAVTHDPEPETLRVTL